MADDLAAMQTACLEEVQVAGDSAVITKHIVAALKFFRGKRFDFSEKTASWSSTAGVKEYVPGSNSTPADVLVVDRITIIASSSRTLLRGPIPIRELRRMQSGILQNGTPEAFAWYANRIHFDVPTKASLTIEMDYVFDATRDATGALITTASATTVTNPFFVRGEELLRARACYTYALGRGNNPDLANRMALLGQSAYRSHMQQRDYAAIASGLQAPAVF